MRITPRARAWCAVQDYRVTSVPERPRQRPPRSYRTVAENVTEIVAKQAYSDTAKLLFWMHLQSDEVALLLSLSAWPLAASRPPDLP